MALSGIFMRAFLIVLVSLVFFTRCGKQQVSQADLPKVIAPIEINYAAGVMISPQKKAALYLCAY